MYVDNRRDAIAVQSAMHDLAANFAEIMKDLGTTRITDLSVKFHRDGSVYATVKQERTLFLNPRQVSE